MKNELKPNSVLANTKNARIHNEKSVKSKLNQTADKLGLRYGHIIYFLLIGFALWQGYTESALILTGLFMHKKGI